MGPKGRLRVHGALPRWHALRKENSPNVCRAKSSGAPDNDLPVNLVPLKHCAGPEAELAADFGGNRNLSLGGQA